MWGVCVAWHDDSRTHLDKQMQWRALLFIGAVDIDTTLLDTRLDTGRIALGGTLKELDFVLATHRMP
jgi:hypothetical protein